MNLFKKRENNTEKLFISAEDIKNATNFIKNTSTHLWLQSNNDIESIVPLFNARKHYKHLKRMIWKHGK